MKGKLTTYPRPYLMVSAGLSFPLTSEEAERLLGSYPVVAVEAERITLNPTGTGFPVYVLPATRGGGPAFGVE